MQAVDQNRQKRASIKRDLAAVADLLAERLDRIASVQQERAATFERLHIAARPDFVVGDRRRQARPRHRRGPAHSRLHPRPHGVGDSAGVLDVVSAALPLTAAGQQPGVTDISLPNGSAALAIQHVLKSLPGRVIVIQERSIRFRRSDAALSVTLSATTGFVVLILGFAFHWQSSRGRRRSHQRCDARPYRYRAQSRTLRIVGLGLVARQDLLVAIDVHDAGGHPQRPFDLGEVNALVKSETSTCSRSLISSFLKIDHIDQTFRMQHTNGHWIWLRVRCELSHGAADAGMHLIGIAVDITEQKSLAEKTVEADLRLRDAIETIPETFVLWDAGDRLVLCNSHFQRLQKPPDSAVTPGTSYETVIEVGSMPEVRSRLHETGSQARARAPSRRNSTTAAGCISASAAQGRRLRLGRTDITRIKEHEQKLVDNDLRLRATVIDLKARRRARTAGPRTCRPRRKIFRGKTAPRKPTRPNPNSWPR